MGGKRNWGVESRRGLDQDVRGTLITCINNVDQAIGSKVAGLDHQPGTRESGKRGNGENTIHARIGGKVYVLICGNQDVEGSRVVEVDQLKRPGRIERFVAVGYVALPGKGRVGVSLVGEPCDHVHAAVGYYKIGIGIPVQVSRSKVVRPPDVWIA